MPTYTTEDIRNIALVGHGGSGKTSLVEALLYHSGAISARGSAEKGTMVCDYDPQEKQHGHSLDNAIVAIDHQGAHINIIDTPGFPDFIGRAISILPATETAAIVVDAQSGVETTTRRMMEHAATQGLCRLLIINRIDADGVDLPALLEEIQDIFGKECLPLNLPAGRASRVVDCFFAPGGDESDFSSVATAHTEIIDQVVEVDEDLMALYLEQGEDLDPEQLHAPFEEALRDGHLVPVCFVSAATGAGIPELMEILVRLMPNPTEGNPPKFLKGEGSGAEPVEVTSDPNRHALAHVFKVSIDPFVGRLGTFRIHQGRIGSDTQLFIGDGRKPFKVGHLFRLHGKEHPEIDAGIPGDICAVAKVDEIHFDAVLHDSHEEDHFHLKSLHCPPPMFALAVSPKRRGDEQKLSEALHKIAAEDPSLVVEYSTSTNETVIRGMGDLHLRVVLERMEGQYNVQVDTRPPRIAYRETIGSQAEGHYRHKKQTGGAGQFGEVFLRVEPLERGGGFEFANAVVGGAIPSQFIPAVEKGVRQAMEQGAIAGYPLQDVRVTVYDGKHHPVDSKEVAFVTAGKRAFIAAVRNARPNILEPIVDVMVTVAQEKMGDIAGDLSGRRGRILGSEAKSEGSVVVAAQAPLAEMDGYQSQLKSLTGGSGAFEMSFSHYEAVPRDIQERLGSQYTAVDSDEG